MADGSFCQPKSQDRSRFLAKSYFCVYVAYHRARVTGGPTDSLSDLICKIDRDPEFRWTKNWLRKIRSRARWIAENKNV